MDQKQAYSPDIAEIQQRVKAFIERKGLSQSDVAKAINRSDATVSQFLSGTYAGNKQTIAKLLAAYVDREEERGAYPKAGIPFVETVVYENIYEVLNRAHLDCEPALIYGDAGIGKTKSVKEYARKFADVILVEADLGYTPRILFMELCRQLNVDPTWHLHDMFDGVVAKLKDSGRFIIIDEAEHLPVKALELVRRIYDKAHIGFALVGMEKLLWNLKGKKNELAQLYSRITYHVKLERLTPGDVEAIVKASLPKSNGVWKVFYQECRGNTRVLCKLIYQAIRIAQNNNIAVDDDVVRASVQMLIP